MRFNKSVLVEASRQNSGVKKYPRLVAQISAQVVVHIGAGNVQSTKTGQRSLMDKEYKSRSVVINGKRIQRLGRNLQTRQAEFRIQNGRKKSKHGNPELQADSRIRQTDRLTDRQKEREW